MIIDNFSTMIYWVLSFDHLSCHICTHVTISDIIILLLDEISLLLRWQVTDKQNVLKKCYTCSDGFRTTPPPKYWENTVLYNKKAAKIDMTNY